MITAPTAGGLLKALARRQAQAQLAFLDNLTNEHREALRRALTAVPQRARIDVGLLVETVREEVAHDAARAPKGDATSYALSLLDLDQLHAVRRALLRGVDLKEAIAAATQLDELEPPAKPPRPISRRQRRGTRADRDPAPTQGIPAERRPTPVQQRPRAFGGGVFFDGDGNRFPPRSAGFTPPWVIS